MSSKVGDLIRQTSSTGGTGDLSLSSVTGPRDFSDEFSTGGTDVIRYHAYNQDTDGEWEVGLCHLSDSSTLVRDTIIASSNGGSKTDFTVGDTVQITCNMESGEIPDPRDGSAGDVPRTDGTNFSITTLAHTDLDTVSSSDHHSKYTDTEARSAVSGTLNHDTLGSITTDNHHAQNHDNADHTTTLSERPLQKDGTLTGTDSSLTYNMNTNFDRIVVDWHITPETSNLFYVRCQVNGHTSTDYDYEKIGGGTDTSVRGHGVCRTNGADANNELAGTFSMLGRSETGSDFRWHLLWADGVGGVRFGSQALNSRVGRNKISTPINSFTLISDNNDNFTVKATVYGFDRS